MRALIARLHDCWVVLSRNGEEADRGVGANALGQPASAVAHLVSVLTPPPQFEPPAPAEVIATGTRAAKDCSRHPPASGGGWGRRGATIHKSIGASAAMTAASASASA